MKKLSFLLAILMAFSMLTFSAFAEDGAMAVISGAEADPGDEIVLNVVIKNSPGIVGAQLYVGYDSNVMSYVSATSSNASFFSEFSKDAGANPVKVVIANLSLKEITGDFSVADIKFKINSDAKKGEYAVSLSAVEAYDHDILPVPVGVENAVIKINGKASVNVGTHKHVYTETVVEPEGANPGYTLYECSCGHTYKGEYVYDIPVEVEEPKFKKLRDYTDSFADVTEGHWFYDYVKIAYEYKLANGTSETTFSPDNKFTVAQALTAAANIHTTYNGTSVRAAVSGEAWYVPYVEYCVDKRIITENQFKNFDANITRGDMAIVFANILPNEEYAAVKEGSNPDVTSDMTCADAVQRLYQAGIVGGDAGTGNYRPNDEIIRSEACVIFTRIAVIEKRAK